LRDIGLPWRQSGRSAAKLSDASLIATLGNVALLIACRKPAYEALLWLGHFSLTQAEGAPIYKCGNLREGWCAWNVMVTTSSAAALLHVALQDLYAGKEAQAARLPGLAVQCRDPVLRELVEAEAGRAAKQAARIRAVAANVTGPENLWMAGILDDAERDTKQTQPGRLLDIALIGAARKAKAAEIVSSETAMALACEVDVSDLLAAVTANHADEIETDRGLKSRLAVLTARE
jgi:ferritin-like metal-binding protein YciE